MVTTTTKRLTSKEKKATKKKDSMMPMTTSPANRSQLPLQIHDMITETKNLLTVDLAIEITETVPETAITRITKTETKGTPVQRTILPSATEIAAIPATKTSGIVITEITQTTGTVTTDQETPGM
jgi:hypothetical protein